MSIEELFAENERLQKENERLQKENEQLKSRISSYQKRAEDMMQQHRRKNRELADFIYQDEYAKNQTY